MDQGCNSNSGNLGLHVHQLNLKEPKSIERRNIIRTFLHKNETIRIIAKHLAILARDRIPKIITWILKPGSKKIRGNLLFEAFSQKQAVTYPREKCTR